MVDRRAQRAKWWQYAGASLALALVLVVSTSFSWGKTKKKSPVVERIGKIADEVALDTAYQKLMEQLPTPGAAIGVIQDGRVIFQKGYGMRNLDPQQPVTPQTLFRIASCTKAFTSLLVGMMVEEGVVGWDVPVKTYLPDFDLKDSFVAERVTVRDLIAHRTGFPSYNTLWFDSHWAPRDLMQRLRFLDAAADLRVGFHYHDLMYMIAGLALESATGKTWEELVKERVLQPLEMVHTQCTVTAAEERALPYLYTESSWKRLPTIDVSAVGPAGTLSATLEDMLRWAQFQLGDGSWGAHRLVQSETLCHLHTPQVALSRYPTSSEICLEGYGLGWSMQAYRGHYCVYHAGNIPGFRSCVAFIPEKNMAVVVLTNGCDTLLPEAVIRTTWDTLLQLPSIDWGARMVQEQQQRQEQREQKMHAVLGRYDPRPLAAPLEQYAGEYAHPAYGAIRIEATAERLYLRFRSLSVPLKGPFADTHSASGGEVFLPDTSAAGSPLIEKLGPLPVTFTHKEGSSAPSSLAIPFESDVPELIFTRSE